MSNYETMKKERLAQDNWRAHIANFVTLYKENDHIAEEYCKKYGLSYEAFQIWLEYIKREDEFVFYYFFAPSRLSDSKKSFGGLLGDALR